MCTQSVGLLAGLLEKAGISTVSLALLRHVAEIVRPPRTLAVPFRFGAPLGGLGAAHQRLVLEQALDLLDVRGPGPLLVDFDTSKPGGGA